MYTIAEGSSAASSLLWDGIGSGGTVLPNGSYTISISALDGAWNAGDECSVEVEVANYME